MPIGSPTTFPLNERAYRIDVTADGTFGELGPAGPGETGVWTLMWCPNLNFIGTLSIVGRIAMDEAATDGAPLVQIPYISVYLNGAPPIAPRAWSYETITGTSLIEIPTAKISPAVLFGVSGGYGKLYVLNASGAYAAV